MNQALTISDAGLKLIQSFEGCEKRIGHNQYRAYRDPVGILTIGWGHTNATGRQFQDGAVWTAAQCDGALQEDLRQFETGVGKLVKVELEQHHFDALVSFAYNCGLGNLKSSSLLRKLNKADFDGAAAEFAKWNKSAGRPLPGLTRRRAAEAALFQGGGHIEVHAREDGAMPQAVDPPAKPSALDVLKESKIAQGTAATTTLGSANETIGAVKDTASELKDVKGVADDIGLWDMVSTLIQQPRFWFALAIVAIGIAVIYFRWRDHA